MPARARPGRPTRPVRPHRLAPAAPIGTAVSAQTRPPASTWSSTTRPPSASPPTCQTSPSWSPIPATNGPDTLALTEQHILPRLREHRVRLVEIARGGPHDADGIAVLSDTRDPRTLHRRGPWTLADELDTTGTVPMRAKGHRRCSLKFKGWVLDTWEAAETQGRPYRVAVGYNAEEVSRALGDVAASVPARRPWYPLIARKLARIDRRGAPPRSVRRALAQVILHLFAHFRAWRPPVSSTSPACAPSRTQGPSR
ncbi:hypothetical protein ACU686_26595 [Yinghuangia aomiensis]